MIQPILRKLRRIEAINGMIRNLAKEREEAEKFVVDALPVHDGDEFSYDNNFCGALVAAWVNCNPDTDKASITIEYRLEDGWNSLLVEVNPKLLRKVKRIKKK